MGINYDIYHMLYNLVGLYPYMIKLDKESMGQQASPSVEACGKNPVRVKTGENVKPGENWSFLPEYLTS